MLAITGATRLYYVAGFTDMRYGKYALANVVRYQLHRNPYNGDGYMFMSKDRQKMKILVYVQSTFSPGNVNQSENYGNYYVDNCVTVPIGQILNLMMADTVQGEGTEGVKTGNDINL